jgi:diguanylate cyclase (GGDEF)-like protein
MPFWVDRFVPPALRADAEILRRARLTVLLSTVLIATALLYAVFYGAIVHFAAAAVASGTGALVGAAALATLRVRPWLRAVGQTLTAVLYGVLVGIIYHSGGLPSVVTPWLALPATMAALMLGRRSAAAWAALSVLTIGAFYLAAAAGARFPVGYGAAWTTAVTVASYCGLVVSTAVLLLVFEDVRAEAQARAEAAGAALAQLAYHDPLTGLTNRGQFLERLGAALSRARAAGDPARVAVLLLDLDGFKAVNDSRGHAGGDAVLIGVAGRLLSATRGSDTVARIGGDEFAVLLDGVREEAEAAVVADRIVAAVAAPFAFDGWQAMVGASVGIARGADGHDVAAVLHEADVAMYRAKALGKGRWVRFEAGSQAALPRGHGSRKAAY